MKKLPFLITLALLSTLVFPNTHVVFAQSEGVQKALENVKDKLDNLVTAKDEKQPMELGLRIETLKKVIDLSITEAKDTRVKLLSLEDLEKNTTLWRDVIAEEMKKDAEYAAGIKKDIENNEKTFTITDVKETAKRFKDWRDTSYLPAVNQIRDYFLTAQEDKTIQTTKTRWQKIDEDIKKLEKAKVKNIESARKLLKNADFLIAESESLNQEAKTLFEDRYITPVVIKETTSTESISTSTEELIFQEKKGTKSDLLETNTATSSSYISSSTDANDESSPLPPASIRDLVTGSLSKIKDTYKVFIEMSNLVRKLLK
ncbi:MAG: hypothetical protein WCW78_03435 [Candidatus Paceibacterota bacterium]|jgi:hypothetical protein